MADRKYAIEYNIVFHATPVTAADVQQRGNGACDSVVLHSVIGTPGGPGPLSVAMISREGNSGEELKPDQLFIIWTLMAADLSKRLSGGWKKELCDYVLNIVRTVVKG